MKKTRQINIILIISILVSMFILPDMSLMTVNAADDSDKYYEKGYFPIFYDENNKNIFESIKDDDGKYYIPGKGERKCISL